jgi:hypothetical protein
LTRSLARNPLFTTSWLQLTFYSEFLLNSIENRKRAPCLILLLVIWWVWPVRAPPWSSEIGLISITTPNLNIFYRIVISLHNIRFIRVDIDSKTAQIRYQVSCSIRSRCYEWTSEGVWKKGGFKEAATTDSFHAKKQKVEPSALTHFLTLHWYKRLIYLRKLIITLQTVTIVTVQSYK